MQTPQPCQAISEAKRNPTRKHYDKQLPINSLLPQSNKTFADNQNTLKSIQFEFLMDLLCSETAGRLVLQRQKLEVL